MTDNSLSRTPELRSVEPQVPQVISVKPKKKRVVKIDKTRPRDEKEDPALQALLSRWQKQDEYLRAISDKIEAWSELLLKTKEDLMQHVDIKIVALEKQIRWLLENPAAGNVRSGSYTSSGESSAKRPIPQFFSSHSPTPNVNSSVLCSSPQVVHAPLQLSACAGGSAFASALQLIFASAWLLQPLYQAPNALFYFAREMLVNRDAACFNLLQALQRSDNRFLRGSDITALDYLMGLLYLAEGQIQTPSRLIPTQYVFKNQYNMPYLIGSFYQAYRYRYDTQMQQICYFELCQTRACYCSCEYVLSSAQMLKISVPMAGRSVLQELVQYYYCAQTQTRCYACGGTLFSAAQLCSLPMQLFVVFDSLVHNQVHFEDFLVLSATITQHTEARYRLNAVIVYNGAGQFATYVVAPDGTRWYCDQYSVVQRLIDYSSAGAFCFSYGRIDV